MGQAAQKCLVCWFVWLFLSEHTRSQLAVLLLTGVLNISATCKYISETDLLRQL